MSPEQILTAAISVGAAIYAVYRSGKTDDDRTRQIAGELLKSHTATTDAEKKVTELQFDHMADNISQIRDSIATLLRKLEESVATKQDILQMDARMDASEESHRNHYESFKKLREQVNASEARLREEINTLRLSCARYHRTGETAAVAKEAVR